MVQKNFVEKLNNLQITMNIWRQWDLSLKGKITVIKSILLPTILYQCSNLYVPPNFTTLVHKELFKFLWNNKPAKIKAETIMADMQEGGLKIPHLPTIVESLKVMWIKRLLMLCLLFLLFRS